MLEPRPTFTCTYVPHFAQQSLASHQKVPLGKALSALWSTRQLLLIFTTYCPKNLRKFFRLKQWLLRVSKPTKITSSSLAKAAETLSIAICVDVMTPLRDGSLEVVLLGPVGTHRNNSLCPPCLLYSLSLHATLIYNHTRWWDIIPNYQHWLCFVKHSHLPQEFFFHQIIITWWASLRDQTPFTTAAVPKQNCAQQSY